MIKRTAIVAAALLTLAGCGSGSSSSTSSTSSASGGSGGYASAPSGDTIEMYDNYFRPKTLTGKAGSTVKVTLKNVGKRDHNFKIDSQKSANADVKPGQTATVSVKIPSSGSQQFYCEYHKGLGMTGVVKPG
jgi:plastocyanin